MKKKPKRKQNWFKIQFKKHPYIYSVLLVWIIFIAPGLSGFYRSWSNKTGDAIVLILFLFTLATFFLWLRKNKSKIFKPILYTLGGIGSLVTIYIIAIIISIGGVTNFIERAKFEYIVWKAESENPSISYCSNADGVIGGMMYSAGYGNFSQYWFKEATQYLDYYGKYKYLSAKEIKKADSFLPFYKGDPEIQLQLAINSKDDNLFYFNHCESTRFLLKAAHQGNKVAEKILASYPDQMSINYILDYLSFFFSKGHYLLDRYDKKITEKNLDNPALVERFASKNYNDKSIYKKYLVQAAEGGYLNAMYYFETLSFDQKINASDCSLLLKYNDYLSEQKSLLSIANQLWASMGKISNDSARTIYECSNKKVDFSKTISLLKKFVENARRGRPDNFSHTYPGMIYFNGWGNVNQDQKLAYELFSAFDDNRNLALAYLAYMNHKGIVIEQNPNKGIGLTIELAKRVPITKTQKYSWGLTLLCGGINYNFIIDDLENENDQQENGKQEKEYRNKLGQCLLESEHEVSIKFLEDYIFNRVSNFFENPELVKTLNYLGEPQ